MNRTLSATFSAAAVLISIALTTVPASSAASRQPRGNAGNEANWVATSGSGEARAVTRDGQGNVVAAGWQRQETPPYEPQFIVTKRTSAGELVWTRVLSAGVEGYDVGHDVATDAAGNVVAVGYTTDDANLAYLTVARWSPSGDLQWSQHLGGPFSRSLVVPPTASLALRSDGNIVVAGSVGDTNLHPAGAVVRVAPDGKWVWTFDALALQGYRCLGLDPRGDVFAAGSAGSMLLVKVDGKSGTLRWQRRFASDTVQPATVGTLAVDRQGNVALGGSALRPGSNGPQLVLAHFNGANGALNWHRYFGDGDAITFGGGFASSAVFNKKGELLVGGTVTGDFAVLRLSAKGKVLWKEQTPGEEVGGSLARTVAWGPHGEMVACGDISRYSGGPDLLTAVWDTHGTMLWKQRLTSEFYLGPADAGMDLAVATDGVAVAGVLGANGNGPGFAVGLLDGWSLQPRNPVWSDTAAPAGAGSSTLNVAADALDLLADAEGEVRWSHASSTPLTLSAGVPGHLEGTTAVPDFGLFGATIGFGRAFVTTRDVHGVLRIEQSPPVAAIPPASGQLSVSATALNFANTRVGKQRSGNVTFRNTGTQPLYLGISAATGGPFTWRTPTGFPPYVGELWPTSFSLDPGAELTLLVTFSPEFRGSYSGGLHVWSSAPGFTDFEIPLHGKGEK